MEASPKVAHSVGSSWLRSMLLGVGIWKVLKVFLPNFMLIISNAPPVMLTPYWLLPNTRFLMFRFVGQEWPLADACWHGAIRMMVASGLLSSMSEI